MKLSFYSSGLVALLSLLLVNVSSLNGQTTAEPKAKKIPFHGKLAAVDASAGTVTVGTKTTRVFHVTGTTKITDGSGNPSTLSSAVVGEDVGGSYTKETMALFSLRLGAKAGSAKAASATETPASSATPPSVTPPPAPTRVAAPEAPLTPAADAPAAKVKKQSFSGKVVSVDAAANTVVVHGKADQTFTLTSTTKITDASGKTASLSDAAAGTKVSGSYSKSADGATLTVYSLKIGK